jgi:hypothetical protein
MDDGLLSEPLWAADGVMAGSPHAIYETGAYLAVMVRLFQELHPSPRHHLSIFVDDLALQVTNETEEGCLTDFLKAGAWIVAELTDPLGLPVEKEKSFLLGSNDSLVKRAEASMALFAGQPVREVRKLGANYTLQHRKGKKPIRAKMVRDRVRRALRRHRRITALAGSRTFGTVFHTGVAQEASFGAELSLVSPVEVANLRKAAVRAHGVAIMGTSHKVSLLAIPLARDPQWMIDCHILGAYAREAYNMVVEPPWITSPP